MKCLAFMLSVLIYTIGNSQIQITQDTSNPTTSCNGTSDGFVNITVTGGQPPYTYDWSNDGSGDFDDPEDITGLATGSYTLVVMDDLGATETLNVFVDTPAPFTFTYIDVQNSCCGANNGSFEILALGGTPGYTYSIDNFVTTQNVGFFVNLFSGLYTLEVTDTNGCIGSTFVALSDNSFFDVNVNTGTTCGTQGTTTADVTVVGGCGTLIYDWEMDGLGDWDDSSSVFGLPPGTYDLYVADDGLCNDMIIVTISSGTDSVGVVLDSVQTNTCLGGSDGAIYPLVEYGAPPFTYDWDIDGLGDMDDNLILSNLPEGTYILVVEDSFGCTDTLEVPVGDGMPFDASITAFNDSLVADQTGDYQWVVCPAYTELVGDTNQSYTATQNGSYAVVFENQDGCIDTSDCVLVEGIGFKEKGGELEIYPNPANDVLRVIAEFPGELILIELNGKEVLQQHINVHQNIVNLESLDAGVYLLRIESPNRTFFQKLVIQH